MFLSAYIVWEFWVLMFRKLQASCKDGKFDTVEQLRKILNLVDPSVYTTTVNSGIYKGYTEAEKIGLDLLPFRKQIVNSLNPDEPARWYK